MSKLRIYRIDSGYIQFLRTIDPRVQHNKGAKRPYVGVVLEIDDYKYFVPMESPKENHKNIKAGGPVLKLADGELGILGFNNMIPVELRHLINFDISQEPDKNYRALLYKQLRCCNENRQLIYSRAATTYRKATSGSVPSYRKICCDFKKLEQSSQLYKKKKGLAHKNG